MWFSEFKNKQNNLRFFFIFLKDFFYQIVVGAFKLTSNQTMYFKISPSFSSQYLEIWTTITLTLLFSQRMSVQFIIQNVNCVLPTEFNRHLSSQQNTLFALLFRSNKILLLCLQFLPGVDFLTVIF